MAGREVVTTLALKLSDKATAPMQKAMNRIDKSTKQVSGSLQRLKTIAVAAFTGWGIYKIVEKMKEVVLAAARYETLGVSMRVVGNNAGYAGQQMNEFQAGLEKTGISMSGARQALTRMTQAQLDLTKSAQLARVAQDTAVIGAINSTKAFNQLVYGIQSANVRVLRTIGINVIFKDSYKGIAEQLGRTVDSFTEAEKASIRLNAVLKAGERIAGTYEAAMETAGKQLFSLERHFDNLKVATGAAFTPALLEIVQSITGEVKDLNKELSGESTQKIHEWGVGFRLTLIDIKIELMGLALLLDKIGGTMTTVMVGLFSFGNAIGNENSQKQYTEWMKKNIEYEKRYWQTVIDIVKLEEKQLDLKYALTDEGKAAAKVVADILEKGRLAASAAAKDLEAQKLAEEATTEALKKANKELKEFYAELDKVKAAMDRIISASLPGLEAIHFKYEKLHKDLDEYGKLAGKTAEEIVKLHESLNLREADKLSDYFDIDFKGTSFGNEMADGINNAIISMKSLNDLFTDHADKQREINEIQDEGFRKQAQAALDAQDADYFQAQISGYRQLFGTVSQLFKENSEEREALHKVEMAFAVMELAMSAKKMAMDATSTVVAIANSAKRCVAWGVEAVAAAVAGIAGQATGDPYTAFARIAVMIVLMGSVLAMAGKAFGGGGGSSGGYSGGTSAPTTGTILGDPTKSSESLQHSLDLMEEYHAEDYIELVGIHNEMKDLNKNITGLVSNIVRSFGTFGGGKFESTELGNWGKYHQKFLDFNEKVLDWVDNFAGSLSFLGDRLTIGISKFSGSIAQWAGEKLFGGKVRTKVTGAGVALGEIIVGDILAGVEVGVRAYFDIYKKTSGGLFGSTKRKRWTEYEEIEPDVERLFNKIYENISDMLVYLGEGFNLSAEDMVAVFSYQFESVKIDLKDLTGEEITEKINAWLSTMGDTAIEALFADVVGKYQEIDEGMLETAMRLLVQKEILFSALEMTNMAFDDTATSAIDFSQALIAVGGEFEDLIESISNYYDKFFTDVEKHQDLMVGLTDQLALQNLVLPDTREGYRALVEGLDLTTELGMRAYVALMNAADAADAYYDYIEKLDEVFAGAISYAGTSAGWQAMAPQATSSTDAWIQQYQHIQDLAVAHDGTTASAIELSDALGVLSGMSYDLAAEMQSAIASIRESYSSAIESMYLETLTGQGKYNYYRSQVDALSAGLSSLTSVEAIKQAMDDILLYSTKAFGMLSEDQKKLFYDQYGSFLSGVEEKGIDQIENIGGAMDDANTKLINELKPLIVNAVAEIKSAALDMKTGGSDVKMGGALILDAAETPVMVQVDVVSGEVG